MTRAAASSASPSFHRRRGRTIPPLSLLLLLLLLTVLRPNPPSPLAACAFSPNPFPVRRTTIPTSSTAPLGGPVARDGTPPHCRCGGVGVAVPPRSLACAPPDGVDDPGVHDDDGSTPSSSSSSSSWGGRAGDAVRSASGIRPSLHPTTINCVAEALLLRCPSVVLRSRDDCRRPSSSDVVVAIDAGDPSNEPIDVAVAAGDIALAAIRRRRDAAGADGDASSAFDADEAQTISGRVVGVVMRMRDLERELVRRVGGSDWVMRYGEEGTFGVLGEECRGFGSTTSLAGAATDDEDDVVLGGGGRPSPTEVLLAERIRADPLFRMNRAECLLALFLETVERPRLEALGMKVPGGSDVDFVDDDRLGVLMTKPLPRGNRSERL
ncbi:hypothetical protein ACHAW5_007335 [Stephanodiscus triporus]|uniref:Uncharacterized protein n=1 Tax=Stephanodiscus triporus TaxID=2934178 RepID=A0ABD3MJQ3_9STRA